MNDLILADQVRAFAYNTYVGPLLPSQYEIHIRAGDVHKAMGFSDRVPLVVAALKAKQFREQYGLDLRAMVGPPVGTNTTFHFRKTVPPQAPLALTDKAWSRSHLP